MDLSPVSKHNHVGKIWEKPEIQLRQCNCKSKVKPHNAERSFDAQGHAQHQYPNLSWGPQTYRSEADR